MKKPKKKIVFISCRYIYKKKWVKYLNSNTKMMVFIVTWFIADYHACQQRSDIPKAETNAMWAFMNI